jgi:hypothetical protein
MGVKHVAVPFEGRLLRSSEIEALQRARAGEHVPPSQVAAVVERLGKCRAAIDAMADWQTPYEQACEAIERLLRHRDELHERVPAMRDVVREMDRLRRERDEAREQAKHAFARAHRLGQEKARQGRVA